MDAKIINFRDAMLARKFPVRFEARPGLIMPDWKVWITVWQSDKSTYPRAWSQGNAIGFASV